MPVSRKPAFRATCGWLDRARPRAGKEPECAVWINSKGTFGFIRRCCSALTGVCFMPLMTLVIILIVVGVLLWLVNTYIPMDPKIKGILNAVVVIGVVIWLLQALGLLGTIENIHIGK
jgi:hypothetical protein